MSDGWQRLALAGGEVAYCRNWLQAEVANALLRAVRDEVAWAQHHVRLFGRMLPSPRLSAWIGDAGAAYTYSRVRHEPLPWTPSLLDLRSRLRTQFGVDFNSVLANLYRDGRDSMGWHADDEPELGPAPVIASVSLGATRQFRFRSRDPEKPESLKVALEHGSLLWMAGATQQRYQHAIDKTCAAVGERINLTFRVVVAASAAGAPAG